MSIEYLKGLNTLRFFAAFFVIISHGQLSVWRLGLAAEPTLTVFNRGGDGVEFFFTLSGFLITYLLIREIKKSHTVNLKKFYLRRIFRIWPLYFLISILGFLLLGIIYPRVFHEQYFEFNIAKGIALFLFFLPNIVTSFYNTGMLYPLWSIGVEEQYYLFLAPLVKLFRTNILMFILIFLFISHLWYFLMFYNYWGADPKWIKFFLSQKFYAMAVGGFFAYIFNSSRSWFEKSFLSNKVFQAAVLAIIGYHYLMGFSFSEQLWFHFLLSILYALLIVNTILPGSFVNIEIQPFSYLGVISYGLYMYHMVVDYILRFVCMKFVKNTILTGLPGALMYHVCLLGITIIVAGLSYKYFESYFLKLKLKYS